MTPAERLRALVKAAPAGVRAALEGMGIEPRIVRRAATGQPVNAADHLRLLARLGVDPVTGDAIESTLVGPLHMPSLSAACRIKRMQEDLSLRIAAKAALMSVSALGRIEKGERTGFEAVLSACAWLNRHPFEFCAPVTRETPVGTKDAA